jgi:signal transduction histidine kinase
MRLDFVSLVSHELRTPLTTLTGFSEMLALRADSLDPELVSEFGHRMWRASRWLSRMIQDLLELSQIEQGSLEFEIVTTDAAKAVEDVVAVQAEPERRIYRTAEADLPSVVADPVRLRQVLGNLLSNARKFSPPDSAIEIDVRRNGDRVEVAVRDHGRGIAPSHLARIFEPFVQTDPATTRAAGGLGTGLYLVKQLCRRMGAEVRVDSVEGDGSTFVVSLAPAPVGALKAAG